VVAAVAVLFVLASAGFILLAFMHHFITCSNRIDRILNTLLCVLVCISALALMPGLKGKLPFPIRSYNFLATGAHTLVLCNIGTGTA